MISVVKAAGATVANGALQLVYQDDQGILTDVFAAGYQIWPADLSAQLFPVSGQQALAVSGADRVGPGRYNATWVSSAAAVGNYVVRWFLTPESGDAEISFDQEFELLLKAYTGPHYASVQDLKDEGLATTVTEAQAQAAIVRASRYVEFFTGRTFGPTFRTIEIDGNGGRALLLEEPIVAIEKIVLSSDSTFPSGQGLVDTTSLKVYNRHIREGLLQPDDRNNPKIEFIHGDDTWERWSINDLFFDGVFWPTGVRNVQLSGIFGYTERDGSYVGHTPDLVREATKMIVFDNLTGMANGSSAARGPVTKERTRDQEVQFAALRATTMTGNRLADVLLAGFRRLPAIRSA